MTTVSLTTAKLLKEAGWPQENPESGLYDAPSTDELLEALPIGYEKDGDYFSLNIHKTNTAKVPGWSVNYASIETDKLDIQTPWGKFSSLPEAAAYVWLELRKQKLV